jgi:serine/threonine-protein kinase
MAPPGDPFVGKVLNNRYLVEAKLGQGGFGAVYRGKQTGVGRDVALKVLHPDMARDPNLIARFRREGSVACNLRDAHTITTYDFDQTPDGTLYIAMELLKGRSLHDVFYERAPLAWLRMFKILEQMCSSTGEAHRQGIVHRDIKPENIYLEDRPGHPDYVKILDFGIAKIISGESGQAPQGPQLTAIGQTLGTLEYMSPEQLMGKQLDGRSDIYAMGVVAYEMITGQLPFPDARGPAELIAAQLRKTPPPPSQVAPKQGIPPEADTIIQCMLEKDRNKRYADADALHAALVEVVGLHSSGVQPRAMTPIPVMASATPVPAPVTPVMPQPRAATPPPNIQPPPVAASVPQPVPPQSTEKVGKVAPIAAGDKKGSLLWLWILVGIVVAAGIAVGIYFGAIRR